MNIQIVSDVHAEFWAAKEKFNFIKPVAPILALLGDTCCCGSADDFETFKRFITELIPLYEHIIIVSGNHEYYYNPSKKAAPLTKANTLQGIDQKISLFCRTSPKLHYLNNNSLKIQMGKTTYLIVGSTLWTWIAPEHRKNIQSSMNDYNYIYVQDNNKIRRITSDDVANLHLKNYKYIRGQINKAKKLNYRVIVLTHHKPYLSENFDPTSLDSAYESDLSKLFGPPISLWAYGHTHVSDLSVKNKTTLYSNPKGYPAQKTKFNASSVVKC